MSWYLTDWQVEQRNSLESHQPHIPHSGRPWMKVICTNNQHILTWVYTRWGFRSLMSCYTPPLIWERWGQCTWTCTRVIPGHVLQWSGGHSDQRRGCTRVLVGINSVLAVSRACFPPCVVCSLLLSCRSVCTCCWKMQRMDLMSVV